METNTFIVDEHILRYFGQHTSLEGTSVHDCRSIVPESLCTAINCWWEFFLLAGSCSRFACDLL